MSPSDWFHTLTGFRETAYDDTRARLAVTDGRLHSSVNGHSYGVGVLETPSLAELRARSGAATRGTGALQVSVVQADVAALHRDPENRGAVFQVASQFNLLEMVGPDVTPEDGVTRYAHDHTQGPACAISAGAATIFRNYFADVNGHAGQRHDRQIDGLADIGAALGNDHGALWTMRNGYALCTSEGLGRIDQQFVALDESGLDDLRARLRVGVHRDVEVTTCPHPDQLVSQVFCSALPVSYTRVPPARWARFASLVLEAAYEATLAAAVESAARTGCASVFLTELGGGAFGNDSAWIHGAIRRALTLAADWPLDVRLVSYGPPSAGLQRLARARD